MNPRLIYAAVSRQAPLFSSAHLQRDAVVHGVDRNSTQQNAPLLTASNRAPIWESGHEPVSWLPETCTRPSLLVLLRSFLIPNNEMQHEGLRRRLLFPLRFSLQM